MGPLASFICMGLSFAFGAVISLAILILCGNLRSRLRYFTDYFIRFSVTKKLDSYMIRGSRMEHMHFSVPVLMSVLLFVGGVY